MSKTSDGAFARLSPREQGILLRRAKGETLRSIGADLGITGERVRQISIKATERLAYTYSRTREEISLPPGVQTLVHRISRTERAAWERWRPFSRYGPPAPTVIPAPAAEDAVNGRG